MEIQQLRVENIGCFPERTFDFSNPTVIFGENRTGKSTLVYALYFALFGNHLHGGLKPQDLCRKGERIGTTTLYFHKNQTMCKMSRSTSGVPVLYTRSEENMTWQPVRPENLKNHVSIPAEVASLTSFFREGELIYFLQDIPKYNQTLLQNLIGIDEVFVVRSRFKKAHTIAREAQKNIQKTASHKGVDVETLQLSRKQMAELEKEFQRIDSDYKQLLEQRKPSIDPNMVKLLQKQYDEKKKEFHSALQLRESLSAVQELEEKKAELEKQLTEKDAVLQCKAELQRQFGSYEQKINDLEADIERLTFLEKQPACPTCGQSVTKTKVSTLISDLKKKKTEAEQNSQKIEKELKEVQVHEQRDEINQASIQEITQQIGEVRRLDGQIMQFTDQLAKMEKELDQFKLVPEHLKDAENHYHRKEELEAKLTILQNQIIQSRVALKQQEDELKRAEEFKKKFQVAERNTLLCQVAHEAIDHAVQEMGRGLMDRVRQSISTWAKHFTFLDQFDIEITAEEITPIIQAKGYHYKLNQMSKSERVFLYLMLKLAIGEALNHLGVFALDDPADGLDLKRKQMLAQLIHEIAQKRQIIVTTNDSAFVELFPEATRIDL